MHIRIEGKLVQQIEERVLRSVELDGWLEALANQHPQKTPVLPVGCRLYSRQGICETYVVEQPPARRRIAWLSDKPWGDAERNEGKWHLAFPYMIFICQPAVGTLRVFYRTAPLSQSDQTLMKCNLGNIYLVSEKVCGAPRESRESAPTAEEMISGFWASTFNGDLLDNFFEMARKDKRLSSLTKWEEASAANALFPLEVEWRPAAFDMKTLEGVTE